MAVGNGGKSTDEVRSGCVGTIDDVKGGVSDVLLYVSEIWVEMGAILMALEGFHHRVAIWIVENIDQHDGDGGWELSPLEEALELSGIWPIKEYIQRRQATIAAHISNQTIYELCMGSEKIPVSSILMRWWDQDVGREVE